MRYQFDPNIATRYIKTTVSAANCSTIVLGGLILDTNTEPKRNSDPQSYSVSLNISTNCKEQGPPGAYHPDASQVALTTSMPIVSARKHEDRSHFGPELEQTMAGLPKPGDGKQSCCRRRPSRDEVTGGDKIGVSSRGAQTPRDLATAFGAHANGKRYTTTLRPAVGSARNRQLLRGPSRLRASG